MGRSLLLTLTLAGAVWPQPSSDSPKEKSKNEPKAQQQEQLPPEEDESLKPKEYGFNPLEAERDVKVGNYYFKKGNYKAAASRFREATKWNPSYAEAYLRLGESEEKMKDKQAAREAYEKYLELAPEAKDAEAIRKKIGAKR